MESNPYGNIVLIGPPGAGKSTIAPLLAQALGLPVLELDDSRWTYYAEIGYDQTYAQELLVEQGLLALVAYWKPFELHAVERVLADYHSHVIAFGAGHSFYEDPAQLQRAQQALATCRAVILLVPSPDLDAAADVLAARFPIDDPFTPILRQVQHTMLHHPANTTLATLTVYTRNQTPAEICAEIVARLPPEHSAVDPV
jgi:hypothetical protein